MKRLIGDHRQIFCPALISLLRVQQLYFHEYPHVIPPAMRNAEAGNGIFFFTAALQASGRHHNSILETSAFCYHIP